MQVTVAVANLAGRTAFVEQFPDDLQLFTPCFEKAVNLIQREACAPRRGEAVMLRFGDVAHLRRAALIKTPLGCRMEHCNMIG